MRIGIDARALTTESGGIAVYTRGLLEALSRRDDDHRYYLYSTRPIEFGRDRRFLRRRAEGFWARKGNLWMQKGLPKAAKEDRIELFFGPLQVLPLGLPRGMPTVLAVHDLVHMVMPGSMKIANFLALRWLLPRSVVRADSIVTGSEHTAGLIRERLHTVDKELRVIYHGRPCRDEDITRENARGFMEQAFGVQGPYILCVGTVEPRKNLETLLRAFRIMLNRHLKKDIRLFLVGHPGWKSKPIRKLVDELRLSDRVRFTGWVNDEDLQRMYKCADLLVFPSLYEGFGFPPLEAMTYEVPVIASETSSLPEVVGDAALLVPPRDPDWLAWQMARVLINPDLRDDLAEKGRLRAEQFSWDRSAAETLDVFRETALRRHRERQERAIRNR